MVAGTRRGYANVTLVTRARMQAVRRRDTGAEMRVRRTLHGLGYRFRLHRQDLPGEPDIVFPRRRKIVLVHGCFWHGHEGCRRAKLPINNVETWRSKINGNRARDDKNVAALRELGWDVFIVWECETHNLEALAVCLDRFLSGQLDAPTMAR